MGRAPFKNGACVLLLFWPRPACSVLRWGAETAIRLTRGLKVAAGRPPARVGNLRHCARARAAGWPTRAASRRAAGAGRPSDRFAQWPRAFPTAANQSHERIPPWTVWRGSSRQPGHAAWLARTLPPGRRALTDCTSVYVSSVRWCWWRMAQLVVCEVSRPALVGAVVGQGARRRLVRWSALY